jgi:uncharacterized protein Smg (DUF494 family)
MDRPWRVAWIDPRRSGPAVNRKPHAQAFGVAPTFADFLPPSHALINHARAWRGARPPICAPSKGAPLFKVQNAELALEILYEMTDADHGRQPNVMVSRDEFDERMQSHGVSHVDIEKALGWLVEQKFAEHKGSRRIGITALGADKYESSDEGKRDPKVLAKVQNGRLALQTLYLMTEEQPGTQTNVMIVRDEFDARMQSHGVSHVDIEKAFGWLWRKDWAKYVGGQMISITKLGQHEFEAVFRN